MRIVVLGYIVRGPLGGLAWHHLQYVLGLRALGHEVVYLEDSDDHPWSCYDPTRGVTDTDPRYGLAFAASVFDRVGLGRAWAYYDAHRRRWHGPAGRHAVDLCNRAELVLNLGGVNPLRAWMGEVRHRVYVDTDPVFTQLGILEDDAARARADAHTAFFTFAGNVGRADAAVPALDRTWLPTRQPVVLDAWALAAAPASGPYTTVMQWESYPAREHRGVRYGMKSESFPPYRALPRLVHAPLELALGGGSAPRDELRRWGWRVVSPLEIAPDPWAYQRYIRRSRGELGVAKHGYVVSRSGWFSERSAGYLASGRPVIAQDTGFTDWLPTGEGLLAFSCPEEAVAAVAGVEARHARHSRAARAIAEQAFDARIVLPRLLEQSVGYAG